MSSLLIYPHSLGYLNHSTKSFDKVSEDRLKQANRHLPANGSVSPSSPIIIPSQNAPAINVNQCSASDHGVLKHLSMTAGGAATAALAELLDNSRLMDITSDTNTIAGGGVGGASGVADKLIQLVQAHDAAVLEFENLRNHRAAPLTMEKAQIKVRSTFNAMNHEFNRRGQSILKRHVSRMETTMTQTGKAAHTTIPVADNIEMQRLAKMAKVGRIAGPGFIAIDGALRVNKVHQMRKKNDPLWKREAVIQGAGFAAGIAAGVAIGFFIVPTAIGLTVGLAAAGAFAYLADKSASSLVSTVYDWVF